MINLSANRCTDVPRGRYWRDEIDSVIKARGLAHVGDYEALTRLGRTVRLGGRERHAVWRLPEALLQGARAPRYP